MKLSQRRLWKLLMLRADCSDQLIRTGLGAVLAVSGLNMAWSQTAFQRQSQALHTMALVAVCANCHDTDGTAVADSDIPKLTGRTKENILSHWQALRHGHRASTVMQQLSKGFSDEQIDAIASYLATQK